MNTMTQNIPPNSPGGTQWATAYQPPAQPLTVQLPPPSGAVGVQRQGSTPQQVTTNDIYRYYLLLLR